MAQLKRSWNFRKFHKQTFIVKNKGKQKYRHTMLVNPQDMSVSEPARVSVQQTLGGAYIANFGQGIHNVTISGTTGYNARINAEGRKTDGYSELQDIRRKLYRDFIRTKSSQLEMFWYNWEDQEYYKIYPTNFRVMRNHAEPTLYRYEMSFTTLANVGRGASPKHSFNQIDSVNVKDRKRKKTSKAIANVSEVQSKIKGGAR